MPLFGLCGDVGPFTAVITPLCDNGDVHNHLSKCEDVDRMAVVSLDHFEGEWH